MCVSRDLCVCCSGGASGWLGLIEDLGAFFGDLKEHFLRTAIWAIWWGGWRHIIFNHASVRRAAKLWRSFCLVTCCGNHS